MIVRRGRRRPSDNVVAFAKGLALVLAAIVVLAIVSWAVQS